MDEAYHAARAALEALTADRALVARLNAVPALLAERLRSGGKIMACGNGGSCADAMHFAEELTGRFRGTRPALAALACTDAGHVTCAANDFGWEAVFARWVEALARPGDVLVALSTSGNSPNIVRALGAARQRGATAIALLGGDGGVVVRQGAADHAFILPGSGSDRIQELHMLTLHAWVEGIERALGFTAPG